ncbi:nuclear transport factor 2 family protein [Streptomyces sp. NBC_01261]|uniref:YybH family protein n=1 Tax=Streptomyces sp. NBC_01261 TaxID=2903802 RepID=UPI002E34BB68|nr:nuclear transport factor 2 family protein [Streptomyces sp. NBC_01261]
MNTGEAAERFVRVWARAWAEHDADALPELYAEDCVHRSMPFREPRRGRAELAACLRWSFEAERVGDVRFSTPVVGQQGVAVAEFRVLTEEDGEPSTLAETRDYWHPEPGHREPTGTLFLN